MAKGGIFNILIILAVLLAGLMIFLVTQLINSAREEGKNSAHSAPVEMVTVLVAASDIEQGIEITPEMVPGKSVPKEFTTPDTVTSFDQVKDKVAGTFIPAGDMIFTSKVKSPDQLNKASLVLEKGKRLITLPSTSETSVSYMAKNGDHVDVLGTFQVEKAERDVDGEWVSREITVTLLQNVKIFDIQFGAAAPKGGSDEAARLGKGATVTFEVTPEEAERLTAATSKAKAFRLTLRRFDDTEIRKSPSIMEGELLKQFLPEPPPPPPPKVEDVAPAPPKPKKYF